MVYGYIYKVTNLINGKIYIGQTTLGFDERYHGGIHSTHNKHLKRAIEKYGVDNFLVEKEYDHAMTKEDLDRLEIFYIKEFKSTDPNFGYNKTTGGGSYTFTQEVKNKISQAKKGTIVSEETKQKLSQIRKGSGNSRFGITLSEEQKAKISKSVSEAIIGENNPMYGKHHTESTKQKISLANSKRVRCHTGEEFNSVDEGAKWCGLKGGSTICRSCKDPKKTGGRHPITNEKLHWEYIN